MNNTIKIIIVILSIIIIGMAYLILDTNKTTIKTTQEITETDSIPAKKAEKIEIVLVHGTVRCFSCNAMEEMTLKTLESNFKEELDSGKITFIDINGEDPINIDMVRKLGATGLSIFINGIVDGKDNIEEERNLWRYIQNEDKFKSYLTEKLNNIFNGKIK